MKFLKRIVKKISRGIRRVGRKIKKAFGKIAKAFGKLGPLGSIALSFILPGIGDAIGKWFSGLPNDSFLVKIVDRLRTGASMIKDGVGTVFNKVTDAIEYGMNAVSKPFMKEGARGMGSAFRDFVSDVTGGFIEKSEVGLTTADGRLITDLNAEERAKLKESGELAKIQETAAMARRKQSFLDRNMREIQIKDNQLPSLKPGETLEYIEGSDGKYRVWKSEEAFEKWNSGAFDVKVPDVVADVKPEEESYSILEGKPDPEMGTRKFLSQSREGKAFKKIAPLSTFGATIEAEEQAIADYNARMIADQKDYFASVGQDVLYGGSKDSLKSSTSPQNFINLDELLTSPDPYKVWIDGIYGSAAVPSGATFDDHLNMAVNSNNYGYHLPQIGGNDD